jgi:hypothetical protein
MSDTPRTDDEIRTPDMLPEYCGEAEIVDASFARQLERELNEARAKIEATASLKVELGNRNAEICKLRAINAELEEALKALMWTLKNSE